VKKGVGPLFSLSWRARPKVLDCARGWTNAPGIVTDVPILSGLSRLAGAYDAFIVDLWGVLHDGVTAFPEAVACLEQLKARGKRILILSNAPRRAAPRRRCSTPSSPPARRSGGT
jgi:hypothetical protein